MSYRFPGRLHELAENIRDLFYRGGLRDADLRHEAARIGPREGDRPGHPIGDGDCGACDGVFARAAGRPCLRERAQRVGKDGPRLLELKEVSFLSWKSRGTGFWRGFLAGFLVGPVVGFAAGGLVPTAPQVRDGVDLDLVIIFSGANKSASALAAVSTSRQNATPGWRADAFGTF